MTDKIVVMATCGSADEAQRLATELVEKRLAACVNLLPAVRSIYHWKGVVEDGEETLIIIKSTRSLFDQLQATISRMHSYEVPEIIALPVIDGAAPYLAWMDRELIRQESE